MGESFVALKSNVAFFICGNIILPFGNQFIEIVNYSKFLKCAKWCIIALSQKLNKI